MKKITMTPQKRKRKYDNMLVDQIDPNLLVPKPIRKVTALTTAQAMGTTPTTLPRSAPSAGVGNTRDDWWQNDRAAQSGGPPDPNPGTLYISDDFQPAVGVYILAAATGVGKTILSMALTAWSNNEGVPSTYISCFEPRSPYIVVGGSTLFTNPVNFWDDVKKVITEGQPDKPRMVILDSATDPLKTFSSKKAYANQSTFVGGMQPSDRGFLNEGSRLAKKNKICFVLPLNSTLVPYVRDLAGGVEGIINVIDVGTFTFADRTAVSGRRFQQVMVPPEYVEAALSWFEFGAYTRTKNRSFKRGFSGI